MSGAPQRRVLVASTRSCERRRGGDDPVGTNFVGQGGTVPTSENPSKSDPLSSTRH